MKKLFMFLLISLFLTGTAKAGDHTFKWDANPASDDVAGYKVYYKIDGPGEPYNGVEADQGPSPIDVGNVTQYTLTVPDFVTPERLRVVVTAYDHETTDPPGGLQSGYSNEVDTDGVPTNPGNLRKVAEAP